MATTTSKSALRTFLDTPSGFGGALGLVLATVQRFFVPFDLVTLAVAFVVVGLVLAVWGERWWPLAGYSLVATGGSSVLALGLLTLVFG